VSAKHLDTRLAFALLLKFYGRHFGFRVCGEAEGEKLAKFLAGDFAQRERRCDMVREQFLGECRVQQLEEVGPVSAEYACPGA
jgi:hypothetical protein